MIRLWRQHPLDGVAKMPIFVTPAERDNEWFASGTFGHRARSYLIADPLD